MSNCPNCEMDRMFGCKCTESEIEEAYERIDRENRMKNLKQEDIEWIKANL